jgi:hypothetical protein
LIAARQKKAEIDLKLSQVDAEGIAKQPDSNESLILAQSERWRRA